MTHVRPLVSTVIAQMLEDAAILRSVRSVLVRAPHVTLLQLGRTDERLAAQLDGLSVAGEHGAQLSRAALERPDVGALFVATVLAIERHDATQIGRLLALTEVVADAPRALASAFGWVSAPLLRGLTAAWLADPSPPARWLGIAACALHRVDPGAVLVSALDHPDAGLRARALRTAGELGRVDLLPACIAHLSDDDEPCRAAAAGAAVLLGDRSDALKHLFDTCLAPGPSQQGALALALCAADHADARDLVQRLAARGAPLRTLIRAAGWAGDIDVVPWLVQHMGDDEHARLAGEAFALLTGADLARLGLEREPPDAFTSGPNDDPEDADVALDEDESLAWPDADKVAAWWLAQASRCAAGHRWFIGETPSRAHCRTVLQDGLQRQRTMAARYLSLLQPGTPLFNTAAPARRQRRLLARMAD